jgi:hypothetical protein
MKTLKQNINLTLKEVSENKKKKLFEGMIISDRFKTILEGKKNKKMFSIITKEINTMIEEGFDKKQINEALSDIFNSVFGTKSNDVYLMWRDHGVNWLLKKMELDMDSETSEYIKKEFEKIPPTSVPELFTDCDKVTDLFVNGLVESFQNKVRTNSEGSPSAVKILMDGVYEMTKDEKFQDMIESKVKNQLCPLLSQIQSKMENQEKEIKSKILSVDSDIESTSDVAV